MSYVVRDHDIIDRAWNLSRTNLLFIFGIIKAASIGLAVTVFLQIFIDLGPTWSWESIRLHLPSLMQWVVSYLCLLVTFDSAMFSTIFLIHMPKKSESFFTFLLVGTEALQFAILSPKLLKVKTGPDMIMSVIAEDWWYAIFFCYSIFMFFIVYFGKIEMEKNVQGFEIGIRPIIAKYLKSFRKAKIIIAIALFTSSSVFITLLWKYDNGFRYFARITSSAFLIVLIFYAFILQHQQRSVVEELFRKYNRQKRSTIQKKALLKNKLDRKVRSFPL